MQVELKHVGYYIFESSWGLDITIKGSIQHIRNKGWFVNSYEDGPSANFDGLDGALRYLQELEESVFYGDVAEGIIEFLYDATDGKEYSGRFIEERYDWIMEFDDYCDLETSFHSLTAAQTHLRTERFLPLVALAATDGKPPIGTTPVCTKYRETLRLKTPLQPRPTIRLKKRKNTIGIDGVSMDFEKWSLLENQLENSLSSMLDNQAVVKCKIDRIVYRDPLNLQIQIDISLSQRA
ncbi:MAG: hypothetical protein V7744_08875 [Pseudomonadales bacterium]